MHVMGHYNCGYSIRGEKDREGVVRGDNCLIILLLLLCGQGRKEERERERERED